MKRRLLPSAFLLVNLVAFSFSPLAHSQVFVNANASGANTGTSWTDAFTDLQDALAAAAAGYEIWVAAGTYKPDAPNGNPASTFLINKNLHLLGGFNGTETSADQRDPEVNETILSGDLNGDDVDDDFVSFKSDNVMTVVSIASNISNETLIDGFTIRNGHADGNSSGQEKSGGGIFSLGAPIISNCVFEQNFALDSGGAIEQGSNSNSAIILENCLFHHNSAMEGLAVYLNLAFFDINNCVFRNNTNLSGVAGGLYILNPRGGTVRNCHFKENQTNGVGGLIVFILSSNDPGNVQVEVLDCVFENNVALNQGVGGLIFTTGGYHSRYVAKRCTFIGNSSDSDGGALWLQFNGASENASILIDSCQFFQNVTENNGSAVYTFIRGKNVELELNRCEFVQNTTNQYSAAVDLWGTGGATGGATGTILVDSCLFEENTSFWSGAMEIGNGWNGGAALDFAVTNSIFKNNEATEGGALRLWCNENSQTDILIDNCEFDGNEGTIRGGAIQVSPDGNDMNVVINRTKFINNESPNGGALNIHSSMDDSHVSIENSLIANNLSDNAAISLESLGSTTFINCTIADNLSNGIELSDQSSLTLQNTILHNPGYTEYVAAPGEVTVTSLGGNLISDNSLAAHALTYDHQEVADPGFVGGGDYHLLSTSFAIDKGVDLGDGTLPTTDMDGDERPYLGGCVDIGMDEAQVVVSSDCLTDSKEVLVLDLLALSPNPASDFVNIKFPDTINGQLEVGLFDVQGKLVRYFPDADQQVFGLQGLVPGMYLVKIVDKKKVYVGKFVKQ